MALDATEARFAARDKEGVLKGATESASIVPCLREEINAATAARYHRAQGLSAYLAKDTEGARLWFAASRQVQPKYNLPETLAPADHPLQQLYLSASAPVDEQRVPSPSQGRLRFDGNTTTQRPLKRPTVFQYVNNVGQIQISQVLHPGDPVPSQGIPSGTQAKKTKPRGLRVGLLVGSGIALAGSGALYVAAASDKQAYENTAVVPKNRSALERLYRSNRTYTITGTICAATGLALGTGAVLVGHW